MSGFWIYRTPQSAPAAYALCDPVTVVGRDPECALMLEDLNVSRRHAKIQLLGSHVLIEDLGSANGTWINHAQESKHWLQEGDHIRLGDTWLIFTESLQPPPTFMPYEESHPETGTPNMPPFGGMAASMPQGHPEPIQIPQSSFPQADAFPSTRAHKAPWIWMSLAFVGIILLPLAALSLMALHFGLRTGEWKLLPSYFSSILENGWSGRLNPAPPPPPETPALKLEPMPGLRIEAPAGALDKARNFQAKTLSISEAREVASKVNEDELLILGGFQVDASMKPEEAFHAPVSFSVDLDRMKIPAEMRSQLQVLRIEEGGRTERLPVKLEGRWATVQARHNASFIMAWGPLGILLALMTAPIWSQYDKGAFSKHWYDELEPYFHVCWPKAMNYRNSAEVQRVKGILEERQRFYLNEPTIRRPDYDRDLDRIEKTRRFLADPQVQACSKLVASMDWKIEHLYPAEVSTTMIALQHAAEYLWTQRKFRRRSGKIEVWIQQPWQHGTEYALTIDNVTTYPYIQVNGDKLPTRWPVPAKFRFQQDGTEVAIVHEVFHVIQKEYFNTSKYLNPGHLLPGGARYEWFNEATAPVIEEEARSYYTDANRKWVEKYETTFEEFDRHGQSPWGQYRLPMDTTGASEEGTRQKGYAASRFLIHLRDTYYKAAPDTFLPKLMENFCTFWTGPIEAMVKTTSNSRQILGLDYLTFCEKNQKSMATTQPNPASLTLSRGNPLGSWELTGPLAAPSLRIAWGYLKPDEIKKAKLLIRAPKAQDPKIAHDWAWSSDVRQVGAFTIPKTMPIFQPLQGNGLNLHRIEYNPDAKSGSGPDSIRLSKGSTTATSLLLLLPPKDPPKLRYEEKEKALRVEVPPSLLWKEGELKEYRVRFHRPKGKPLTFGLGDKTEALIRWDQLMPTDDPSITPQALRKFMDSFTPQDFQDMLEVSQYLMARSGKGPELQISYLEMVKKDPDDPEDPGLEGPESVIFKVPIENLIPGGGRGISSGVYSGQIMLIHKPVHLNLSGGSGTISWGDSNYPFECEWNSKEDALILSPLVTEGGRTYRSGFNLYLRALPSGALWLGAPPAVLRRGAATKTSEPGWWDRWFGGSKTPATPFAQPRKDAP